MPLPFENVIIIQLTITWKMPTMYVAFICNIMDLLLSNT